MKGDVQPNHEGDVLQTIKRYSLLQLLCSVTVILAVAAIVYNFSEFGTYVQIYSPFVVVAPNLSNSNQTTVVYTQIVENINASINNININKPNYTKTKTKAKLTLTSTSQVLNGATTTSSTVGPSNELNPLNPNNFVQMSTKYHIGPLTSIIDNILGQNNTKNRNRLKLGDLIGYCPSETNFTFLHSYYKNVLLGQESRLPSLHNYTRINNDIDKDKDKKGKNKNKNINKNKLNGRRIKQINGYLKRLNESRMGCNYDCKFNGKVIGLGFMKSGTTSLNQFLKNTLCYDTMISTIYNLPYKRFLPNTMCQSQYMYLKHISEIIYFLFSTQGISNDIKYRSDFSNNFGDAPWLYLSSFDQIWYDNMNQDRMQNSTQNSTGTIGLIDNVDEVDYIDNIIDKTGKVGHPITVNVTNDNINSLHLSQENMDNFNRDLNSYCGKIVQMIDTYLANTNKDASNGKYQLNSNDNHTYDNLMNQILLTQNDFFSKQFEFENINSTDTYLENQLLDQINTLYVLTLRASTWDLVNSRVKYTLAMVKENNVNQNRRVSQILKNLDDYKIYVHDDLNIYEFSNYLSMLYELHNLEIIYHFAVRNKLNQLLMINIQQEKYDFKQQSVAVTLAQFLQCKAKIGNPTSINNLRFPKTNQQAHPQLRQVSQFLPKQVSLNWRKFFSVKNATFSDRENGNDIVLDKTPIIKGVYYPVPKLWMDVIST